MATPPGFVLVMRHAEQPQDPRDPNLSPDGLARAEKLASYIPATLGMPDFIFTAAISKHSMRPYETVEPLAKQTGRPVDATVADQGYDVLASDLLAGGPYAAKQGVIC